VDLLGAIKELVPDQAVAEQSQQDEKVGIQSFAACSTEMDDSDKKKLDKKKK
jgi:hypothetical protein